MANFRLKKPRAFTLIELMVVVSIIALLVALLLPAIGKAKAEAMKSTCGSRLHAIGIAMATYLSSWDYRYPVNGIDFPKSQVPTKYSSDPVTYSVFVNAEVTNMDMLLQEVVALWPYMGGVSPVPGVALPLPPIDPKIAKAYLCPADDLVRTNADTSVDNQPLTLQPQATGYPLVSRGAGAPGYWSYSVNSVLNSLGRFRNNFLDSTGQYNIPWNDPLRQSAIRRESEFITFVEEGDESKFNDEVMDAPAYSNGTTTDPNGNKLVDLLADRHRNQGNVMFADGHTESFNAVIFNYVPPAAGTNPHLNAMQSPITRMFFPDYGDFAATLAP